MKTKLNEQEVVKANIKGAVSWVAKAYIDSITANEETPSPKSLEDLKDEIFEVVSIDSYLEGTEFCKLSKPAVRRCVRNVGFEVVEEMIDKELESNEYVKNLSKMLGSKGGTDMELTIIDMKSNKDFKQVIYSIGHYKVNVITSRKSNHRTLQVFKDPKTKYLPSIIYNELFFEESHPKFFSVQTMSYGDVKTEKLKPIIAGYQEALEVVEVLNKKFLPAKER